MLAIEFDESRGFRDSVNAFHCYNDKFTDDEEAMS